VKEHFFSIIMPVYNRATFIEKSIQSVLLQTYSHFELIVVDDGSTDNTADVVKQLINQHPDKPIKYFYKENEERAVARNYGADRASGAYLNFFDSDDLLYPHHLLRANQFLTAHPEADWFHLGYDIKDEKLHLLGKGPAFNEHPNRLLITGNHLSCNGVFIRKELFSKTRFNTNRLLSGLEDWELWLRISTLYPLFYENTVTSSVLQHRDRSVLDKNASKLIQRVNLLMQLVENNASIRQFMGKDYSQFKSSCTSYISLHLALMKNQKRATLEYLFKTLLIEPGFIFKHRFYAILKHLL